MQSRVQAEIAPPGRTTRGGTQVPRRDAEEARHLPGPKTQQDLRLSAGGTSEGPSPFGSTVPSLPWSIGNIPVLPPKPGTRLLRKPSATPNGAPGQLGQAYRSGGSRSAAGAINLDGAGGTPLPSGVAHAASQRFGFNFGHVRVHADERADGLCREVNADAFTVADNVFFRSRKYAPSHSEGDRLLHHELAHVAQFRQGLLGRPESELESQADRAAAGRNVFAQAPARPVAAPPRLLRQVAGAQCTGIDVILPHTIIFHGTSGDIKARVTVDSNLPPGSYDVTYDLDKRQLSIPSVAGGTLLTVSGDIKGTKAQIKAMQDEFEAYLKSLAAKPASITVRGAQSDPGEPQGPGKGGGTGGDHGGKDSGPGDASPHGKAGGKAGGKPGGTGTGSTPAPGPGKTTAPGQGGGTSPVAQQGSGGTAVKIDDPKQINELRRLGLLDDKTAADIKDQSAKQKPIPFDELMALYRALSERMVLKAPGKDKPKPGAKQDDWMDVARFIQANRDKFSGQQKTGDGGLTLDDMKAILAKYHEFVGVKDPNNAGAKPDEQKTQQDKLEHFDPEKRKSWNSLQPWEKDIWQKYTAKYGQPANDDPTADLHLTPAMKMSLALHMSPDFVKEGGREAFYQLINDPIFIAGTMISITLYVAAWLAPEPLFSKATAAAITIALLSFFTLSEIKNFAVAWMRLSDESEAANDFDDLEAAAQHFGNAMGGILMRVLVTIATMLAGEVLPGPKPVEGGGGGTPGMAPDPIEPGGGGGGGGRGGGGGGGGLRPATAGGPDVGAVTSAPPAVGIKVLADGTVVMAPVATATAVHAMAVQNGGGGTSGGSGGGSGRGSGKGSGKRGTPQEKVPVKEETPPEGTQGIKAVGKYAPDVEQQQGVGNQVGNFAHTWFEKLSTWIKDPAVISEEPPAGTKAEYRTKNPGYTPRNAPRIDRLDQANHMVIEFKPKGLYEQGLAEAKAYALDMDKYETLPGGARWQAKCITYDFDMVLDYMESIGEIAPEDAAAFRAKYTPKK